MVFYELSDNGAFEPTWTSAVSIRPMSHVVQWHCPQCGRADTYPARSFDVVLEGGAQFPDFLGCGACPFLIVSERVVKVFEAAGVQSFLKYPVGAAAVQESELRKESAPRYYRIEITGECMVDLAQSGIMITGICGRCGEVERKPITVRPLKILEGSWDGSDLFRDRRLFPRVCFGTQKVADLVHAHALTNCRLRQMA